MASDSDYGSDLDDATATALFEAITPPDQAIAPPDQAIALPDQAIALPDQAITPPDRAIAPADAVDQRVDRGLARLRHTLDAAHELQRSFPPYRHCQRHVAVEIEYHERNRDAFSPSPEASPDTPAAYQHPLHRRVSTDRRSPMQRFRAPPRKPLSVTDLVSPAWCEQQYEYSLTQHGRISPTAAMRLGKRLHRARESLVKVTRPVCVVSAEDRFALRLWNAITGLRALRVDGRARELEVVGVVDGEVVVGVIDELTSACPAADMEDTSPAADMEDADMPTYYLVDVKTRRSPSLPAPGVLERPMHMQLMLYHRLLAAQAANQVDPAIIFARYALNPHARLSDAFLATLSALAPAEHHEPEHHPTLSSLWALLTAESALTLPRPASLSPLLTAEYRSVSPDPAVPSTLLGRRSFPLDPVAAAAYVADALRWWRGARPTRGVPVAEAFKCRLCDFAPACVWRATRVEEPLRKAALAMERARSRV